MNPQIRGQLAYVVSSCVVDKTGSSLY